MRLDFNYKIGIGALLALLLMFECVATAQVASALIREGEALPGDTLGSSITGIGNSAQNSVGGYAFSVTTDGSFSHVWGHATGGTGTVFLSESTYGNLMQVSFESFFGMSDAGAIFYSASTDEIVGGGTGLDGVWTDTTLLVNEEEPVNELIGQWHTFNSRPGITANGIPYWVGGYADNPGDPTADRALFRTDGVNMILRGGSFIAGVNLPISMGSGIDFDVRYSNMGTNYILPVDVNSGSSTNDIVVISNGTALTDAGGAILREATAVSGAAGGTGGEAYDNFDFVGISEAGNFFVTGDTDGATTTDEFVMIDGEFVLKEGDMIGSMTLSGSIEGGFFNEDGDYAVIWDVNSGPDNLEALIVNGRVVLLEGDAIDWNGDGTIDGSDQGATLTDFTGISALTLSNRDGSLVDLCFTADCDVNGTVLEGGFFMTVDLSPVQTVNVDSFNVTRGEYVSGGLPELANSDNSDLVARRANNDIQSRVFVEFKSFSPTETPSRFDLTFEAAVFARSTVVQSIDMFNYDTGDWEEVDSRNAQRLVDLVTVVTPAGDLSRFVEPGTGCIEARVRFQSVSPRQKFSANIDHVIWTISP